VTKLEGMKGGGTTKFVYRHDCHKTLHWLIYACVGDPDYFRHEMRAEI
jgi:hypothetical protein